MNKLLPNHSNNSIDIEIMYIFTSVFMPFIFDRLIFIRKICFQQKLFMGNVCIRGMVICHLSRHQYQVPLQRALSITTLSRGNQKISKIPDMTKLDGFSQVGNLSKRVFYHIT